jgi:diacylglycerol kinase
VKKHIIRLGKSFGYATKGIHHTYLTQQNIWIHSLFAISAIILGIFVDLTFVEWAVLTLTILVVLLAEMLNTVAETIVDLASPEYSGLGKIAKDIAAGSVLVAAIGAVIIGALLFLPKILMMWRFI